MELSQIKKIIDQKNWYQQGAAAKLFYISHPWFACGEMAINGRIIPVYYQILFNVRGDFMDNYIAVDSMVRVAKYYYNRQTGDNKFIEKFRARLVKKYVAPYRKILDQILDSDLSVCSDDELLKVFKKFNLIYYHLWRELIFLDSFDYFGEKLLHQRMTADQAEIPADGLALMLSPRRPSAAQQSSFLTLNLAERVIKNNQVNASFFTHDNFLEVIEKYLIIKKVLGHHSRKFYWLYNDYATVEYLSPEFFYKNFVELINQPEKLSADRRAKDFFAKISDKKQQLIHQYKLPPKFLKLVNFLAVLSELRDARKSYNQMAGNALDKFGHEFCRRTGISQDIINNLTWQEVEKIFSQNNLAAIGRKRQQDFMVYIGEQSQWISFFGDDAITLHRHIAARINQNKKLIGRPAYPGVVRGTIKIIKTKSDFSKMKTGDILVAPNTRPEYLPVMKIAGAIITEEGGITCHAAIVSRELEIPCVVGVQGAIGILKDGDEVEVDAEKGIIKLINS